VQELSVAVVGGLANGAVYALIALGLVLAFRATSTFNFAHGELMIFPAFVIGKWVAAGAFPIAVAIVLALLITGGIGALFYRLVLQRTVGMPLWMGFIASLGLASILDGVIGLLFGSQTYSFNLGLLPQGVTRIFGARISNASLVLTAFSVALCVAIALLLRYTFAGTAVRAAGQDAQLASQSGVNVRWVFVGSWALAAMLAGVAGVIYGSTNVVTPDLEQIAWAAFPAILLGGLDSVEGALVGGLLIGILQGVTATYLGGSYIDLTTYSVLLAVLLLRPSGLFGTKAVIRL
jgi:branched-chain amino acid transport system permease protein